MSILNGLKFKPMCFVFVPLLALVIYLAYGLTGYYYWTKGYALSKHRQYQEAADAFGVASRFYSGSGSIYHLQGIAYFQAKDYRRAIPLLLKCLDLSPHRMSEVGYQVALAYARDHQADKAHQYWKLYHEEGGRKTMNQFLEDVKFYEPPPN